MENDEFAIDNGNQVMTLNQTDFASQARAIFKTVKHFNPSTITVKDSVIVRAHGVIISRIQQRSGVFD